MCCLGEFGTKHCSEVTLRGSIHGAFGLWQQRKSHLPYLRKISLIALHQTGTVEVEAKCIRHHLGLL